MLHLVNVPKHLQRDWNGRAECEYYYSNGVTHSFDRAGGIVESVLPIKAKQPKLLAAATTTPFLEKEGKRRMIWSPLQSHRTIYRRVCVCVCCQKKVKKSCTPKHVCVDDDGGERNHWKVATAELLTSFWPRRANANPSLGFYLSRVHSGAASLHFPALSHLIRTTKGRHLGVFEFLK